METRYLLRNKIFEENTHIFGPPMVKESKFEHAALALNLLQRVAFLRGHTVHVTTVKPNLCSRKTWWSRFEMNSLSKRGKMYSFFNELHALSTENHVSQLRANALQVTPRALI